MIPSDFAKDDCTSGAEALARMRAGYARRHASYEGRAIAAAPEPPPQVRMRKPAPPAPKPAPQPEPVPAPAAIEASEPPPIAVIPLSKILVATADYFRMPLVEFISQRRAYPHPFARQIAMYLACKLTPFSLPRIGRAIARDHTTVLHGRYRIEGLLAMGHAETKTAVDAITAFLETGIRDFPAAPFVPRPGRWWLHHEIKMLRIMTEKGAKPEEIALAIGRSARAVQDKLKALKKAQTA